jgi:hypothetical protein
MAARREQRALNENQSQLVNKPDADLTFLEQFAAADKNHYHCDLPDARPRHAALIRVYRSSGIAVSPAASAANAGTIQRDPARARRRFLFLQWLRSIHGWLGLWGALLGLLFGFTGILQNHRAVMKIELPAPAVSNIEVALPNPAPADPETLGKWLQAELKFDMAIGRVQREKAQTVTWGTQTITQPERWSIRFNSPDDMVQADYSVGSNTVKVQRTQPGLLGTLINLHKASGTSIGWILLADTIGGAMILLSVTGVILWTELNRRRTIGATIAVVSIVATAVFVTQSL